MTRPLLAIVGPTCTGKTALAVAVARRLGSAELINADSRQLRRGLHVGTCAPREHELGGVPCHLLGLADPGEPFSVAQWLDAARAALDELERRRAAAIVVGGTGLYVSALVDGFDLGDTPPDPQRRAERTGLALSPGGLTQLANELRSRDPDGAAGVDLRNPRRVVRALEILDGRGVSLVDARRAHGRQALLVGLDVDPETHASWLRARVFGMFDSGALLAEVEAALQRGVPPVALAASGIGYAEAMDVVAGRSDAAAAARTTLGRTLRYAKAQRTYFRRDRRIHWLKRREDDLLDLVEVTLGHAREAGVAPARAAAEAPSRQ